MNSLPGFSTTAPAPLMHPLSRVCGLLLGALVLLNTACGPKSSDTAREDANAAGEGERAVPDLSEVQETGGSVRIGVPNPEGGVIRASVRLDDVALFVGRTDAPDQIELRGEGIVLRATTAEGAIPREGENQLAPGAMPGRAFVISSSEDYPETLFAPENIDQMNVTGGALVVQSYVDSSGAFQDSWTASGTLELAGENGETTGATLEIKGAISVSF